MKLIVGLGNPGLTYKNTRHNVGFMFLDELQRNYKFEFKLDKKLKGYIGKMKIKDEDIIFLKPVTYMNLSGNSISKVLNYYKIDVKDMLVIHDDLDLHTGSIRFRSKGSAGGHNGLKSIISHVGEAFNRCKIGIDKGNDTIAHVLSKFSKDELISINNAIEKVSDAIDDFINEKSFEEIMNKYNLKEKIEA